MAKSDIPKPVRVFIARHLTSVEELDVLLMLRAVPDKVWSVDEIRLALSSSEHAIRVRLRHLVQHRLVDSKDDGTFCYGVDAGDRRTVDDLADAYAKRRAAVIALIFATPSEGVRSFSDAFRFRDDR